MYVQIISGVAMFSMLALSFVNIVTQSVASIAISTAKAQIFSHRSHIETMLRSEAAWELTLNHPSNAGNFACLLNPANPCPPNMTFNLSDPSGALLYGAAMDPSFGFDQNGAVCTGYSSGQGNDSCPFGLRLRWARVCPTSMCKNPASPKCKAIACDQPLAEITVDFSYNPKTEVFPFDINKLDLTLLRSRNNDRPSNIFSAGSFGWVDLGNTIVIGGNLVRLREFAFTVSSPGLSVVSVSIFNSVKWNSANSKDFLNSISTIKVDGVICSRHRVSSVIGNVNESTTACVKNLTEGEHTIYVSGSGWAGTPVAGPVMSPDFSGGHVGYQILAR